MSTIDDICPPEIKQQRLTLTLDPLNPTPRVRQPVVVNCDYAATAPNGVVPPLVLDIQGPSPESSSTRHFTIEPPEFLTWTPREGGAYVLSLREQGHNLWWGSLSVEVEGDPIGVED